jgi:hypothetical protein
VLGGRCRDDDTGDSRKIGRRGDHRDGTALETETSSIPRRIGDDDVAAERH